MMAEGCGRQQVFRTRLGYVTWYLRKASMLFPETTKIKLGMNHETSWQFMEISRKIEAKVSEVFLASFSPPNLRRFAPWQCLGWSAPTSLQPACSLSCLRSGFVLNTKHAFRTLFNFQHPTLLQVILSQINSNQTFQCSSKKNETWDDNSPHPTPLAPPLSKLWWLGCPNSRTPPLVRWSSLQSPAPRPGREREPVF